jgi:prolyl-tRNA synthetase
MGCYGIGITRLPAAAIEQNHDERGIIWPDAIAPFTVVVCPIGMDRSAEVKAAPKALRAVACAGVDVLLDDRGERPGAMFADWELIGVPHRVVISDRGLKEGQLEYQHRRDTAATKVPAAGIAGFIPASSRNEPGGGLTTPVPGRRRARRRSGLLSLPQAAHAPARRSRSR